MRASHRGAWAAGAVVVALLAGACGGDDDADSAEQASATKDTTTSSTTTTELTSSGSASGSGTADEQTLDATIWTPNGLQVSVSKVAYDPATTTLTVTATWQNDSRTEESAGTVDLGIIVGDDEFRGASPSKKYPPGGIPVNDPFEVTGLPEDFSLADASLYFGSAAEQRSTIELTEDGAVTTAAPRDVPVTGTVTAGYGGTVTISKGQVLPWACSSTSDGAHLQFVPAKKDALSILLTGEFRSTESPRGGYNYTPSAGGFTQLLLPDATILAATSTITDVMDPNEVIRDGPICFSGVLDPGTGSYELQMNNGAAPTGTLRFDVPPA